MNEIEVRAPRRHGHIIRFTAAEQFFYEHAGYRRDPDEPPYSGRARCAILLADAEATAKRKGWTTVWDIDPDAEIVPSDSYFVSGAAHWQAALIDADENVLASLCSIDLGFADGTDGDPKWPSDDPYSRVVAAELAAEALS
jgi:hypothetical protein